MKEIDNWVSMNNSIDNSNEESDTVDSQSDSDSPLLDNIESSDSSDEIIDNDILLNSWNTQFLNNGIEWEESKSRHTTVSSILDDPNQSHGAQNVHSGYRNIFEDTIPSTITPSRQYFPLENALEWLLVGFYMSGEEPPSKTVMNKTLNLLHSIKENRISLENVEIPKNYERIKYLMRRFVKPPPIVTKTIPVSEIMENTQFAALLIKQNATITHKPEESTVSINYIPIASQLSYLTLMPSFLSQIDFDHSRVVTDDTPITNWNDTYFMRHYEMFREHQFLWIRNNFIVRPLQIIRDRRTEALWRLERIDWELPLPFVTNMLVSFRNYVIYPLKILS